MKTPKYIWINGKFVAWEKAYVHSLSHTLHYGGGAFEGIRCYKTKNGPAIFKLDKHVKRLFYSASVLEMKIPYSQQKVKKAILDTIQKNKLESCYIRPIVIYGYGKMGLNPKDVPVDLIIAAWPWGAYLGDHDSVSVGVSKYIRIHPKSTVADAKISGHYVNSILASLEAKQKGFDEALFLDYKGNVAEGPGENIFVIKGKNIYTPKLGTILAGITRASVCELAKKMGYKIIEKDLKVKDVEKADGAFFTGTAAEITKIGKINKKKIGNKNGAEIADKIKREFFKIVKGENKKYYRWLTFIK